MNLRPSGYEPDELPTAPPRVKVLITEYIPILTEKFAIVKLLMAEMAI